MKGRNQDQQRKAMFSKMNRGNSANFQPHFIKEPFGLPRELQPTGKFKRIQSPKNKFFDRLNKKATYKGKDYTITDFFKGQYKLSRAGHKNIWVDPNKLDSDKDGVPDHKDCKPFDPKKQGFLHDWAMKRLEKKEEKLEGQREQESAKMEDLKESLEKKQELSQKQTEVKNTELKAKEKIVDEINREKAETQVLKDQNAEIKKKLEKGTFLGGLKEASKNILEASERTIKRVAPIVGRGLVKGASVVGKRAIIGARIIAEQQKLIKKRQANRSTYSRTSRRSTKGLNEVERLRIKLAKASLKSQIKSLKDNKIKTKTGKKLTEVENLRIKLAKASLKSQIKNLKTGKNVHKQKRKNRSHKKKRSHKKRTHKKISKPFIDIKL